MGNSLQDQLLKAGLANKKQAVRAKKAKNSKEKLKRTGKEVEDEAAVLARQAQEAKLARDKELNQEKNRKAEQAAIEAQIRQLIQLNRVAERGDVEYRFSDGSLIKTLLLTDAHRNAVVSGALAVVKQGENYDVITRKAAEKIAERNASCVLVCNEASEDSAVEDEYADFKVPDDLMW